MNWDPLIQAGASIITLVLIPWAIIAYQKRTGVQVTQQQRDAIMTAVDTGKGLLETAIDQKKLNVQNITPRDPAVQVIAQGALDRVPEAATAQGTTLDAMAHMIVARVDTSKPTT